MYCTGICLIKTIFEPLNTNASSTPLSPRLSRVLQSSSGESSLLAQTGPECSVLWDFLFITWRATNYNRRWWKLRKPVRPVLERFNNRARGHACTLRVPSTSRLAASLAHLQLFVERDRSTNCTSFFDLRFMFTYFIFSNILKLEHI